MMFPEDSQGDVLGFGILQGTINSIVDTYRKEKVVYYQVDLELTNLESNEVVWMGDKKIKKQVSDRAF